MYLVIDHRDSDTKRISSLAHSVEALSPKKSICAQKAINFSIPTKIVVAARQSVKSQLHVGKQPTKNQAVKIGQPRTWPYQTPKRDVRATTWKKRQQKCLFSLTTKRLYDVTVNMYLLTCHALTVSPVAKRVWV